MKPTPSSNVSAARAAAWRKLMSLAAGRTATLSEPAEEPAAERRDRAQSNRLVQGVLRNLSLLDAWLLRLNLFDPAKNPSRLNCGSYAWPCLKKYFETDTPDYAIGEQAVELARQAGGVRAGRFANAIIRAPVAGAPGIHRGNEGRSFLGRPALAGALVDPPGGRAGPGERLRR